MACGRVWWAAWGCLAAWVCVASCVPVANERNKALYILLDGFRWDYVDKQDASALPGFTRFLQEGVRAQWTNPLFPSISYPTWTTLSTGRFAETHDIVGNWFYDANDKDNFSLFDADSTGKAKWWTSEPIWTTAEKAGLRTAQFLWSRCDVPIDGITTEFCEHFVKIPGKEIFETNIQRALQKFDEGFDFVQVYTEHTDNTGHKYGPQSDEILQAVRDLDDVIVQLFAGLEQRGILDSVNIVIVSDHGMTNTGQSTTQFHEIDSYVNISLIENMADKGAFMNIKVLPGNVDEVFAQASKIPGVTAFKHADVPEEFHFQDSPYIYDIILLADKGNYIMASHSNVQLPPREGDSVSTGNHGFHPDEQDMKGIFFARGPAFQSAKVVEPIHVADVYQVLAHVLALTPQPHNGTWSHVEGIFKPDPFSFSFGAAASLLPAPLTMLPALFLATWCLLGGAGHRRV